MKSQVWMIMAIMCASLMQISFTSEAADRIVSLPGQPKVNFQQFGGYVTVDEKQQRALFYYFVEAESDPASKPLVLWLSGGPGCSSLGYGAFLETGPFKASGESGDFLIINHYSWNKEANMLYVDAPAGSGFSYSRDPSFYTYVNDSMTAQDNLEFLRRWFVKFPRYKGRDLFIIGDSYAGHFVPQLAELIIQSGVKFNLKGIALGNPLLEFSADMNARAEFYWSHGLISDHTYELLHSVCNASRLLRERDIIGSLSATCSRVNDQLSREIPASLDQLEVIADTCLLDILPQALHQPQDNEKIDLCILAKTSNYLNRKDVQEAFHAQLVGVSNLTLYNSSAFQYDKENAEIPTIYVVGSLLKSGIRVMVYSGDQDTLVPFTATRTLVDGLAKQLGLNTTVPYRGWFEARQVGGWTQAYGDNLTFATIRAGNHLTPLSSPARSLALFIAFLEGKPLPEA